MFRIFVVSPKNAVVERLAQLLIELLGSEVSIELLDILKYVRLELIGSALSPL
jgi:hypothetical protein